MSTYEITVYTQVACQPCRITKKKLDEAGVAYREFDATHIDNHRYIVQQLRHQQVPVVTVKRDGVLWVHWSGLQPDLLADVIGTIKAQVAA